MRKQYDFSKGIKNPYFEKLMGTRWRYCRTCHAWMIICPKCGNNSCNGSWGPLIGPDAHTCPVCPQVDKYLDAHWEERPKGIRSLALRTIRWTFDHVQLLWYPKRLLLYISYLKMMHGW